MIKFRHGAALFITSICSFFAGWVILGLMVAYYPATAHAAEKATGSIKGKVNYCGNGGYVGMQVFIPGRQFSVLLGKDGQFVFERVPAGSYEIDYVINGKLVNVNKNVMLGAGEKLDIGQIVFCADSAVQGQNSASTPPAKTGEINSAAQNDCSANPGSPDCMDADKDGVVAKLDCNDHDPTVHPGAIEKCDGIDNNCDGKIDEVFSVNIANGFGSCKSGSIQVMSCKKGFADCDKDPTNGCETDIYNDPANCGACKNACSEVDICRLGMC